MTTLALAVAGLVLLTEVATWMRAVELQTEIESRRGDTQRLVHRVQEEVAYHLELHKPSCHASSRGTS